MRNTLSIAIPTYNRRQAVRSLVRSLVPQVEGMGAEAELIVVDDGSRDGTAEALGAVPQVRLVRHADNQGMVRTWNDCLRSAANDWICIIHDDDAVRPGALSTIRRACAEAGGPALIAHRPGTGWDAGEGDQGFRCLKADPGPWAVLNSSLIPSGVTVHRDIVAAIGTFDERYAYSADIEYFARICARYPTVLIENPAPIEYRLHSANYQYRTWRRQDFLLQLEEIERRVIAYAGLTEEAGQVPRQRRLATHAVHMFLSAARLHDPALLRETASRLLRMPQVSWTMRQRARLALLLGRLPERLA